MTGDKWYLRNNDQKAAIAAYIATLEVSAENPYVAQIIPWTKKRSTDQNALAHKWYREISKQGKEYTPIQVKARSKYCWGVPIMLAASASFVKAWSAMTEKFNYEELLEILEWFPVTSIMDTKQMSQYLSDMQATVSTKYKLTDPSLYGL